MYIMVEARKVVDQERSHAKYPQLKFYSDWTVHSTEDRVTSEMKEIVRKMYENATAEILSGDKMLIDRKEITNVAYMRGLAADLHSFLEALKATASMTI